MWKCLVCFAGAKVIGETEAIMPPGEIRIDDNRGLHFTNRHFDFTVKHMQTPQGDMPLRFVGIERYRLLGRRCGR